MIPRPPARLARVVAVLAALVAVLVAATVPARAQASADAPLTIERVDATGFPLVRAVVSGPTITGDAEGAFVITEDGESRTVDVQRLRTDELNLVVAIDVSGSMQGEPIDRARTAVGELLDNLSDDVPVAVVAFGEQAVLAHGFTQDRESIRAAVDGLVAAGGTALFDGIDESLDQLAVRGGTSALVVLADGADSSSATPGQTILDRLEATAVDASFVALQTEDLDEAAFAALAAAAQGDVRTVEQASEFGEVFAGIASGLSGLYELRWTSASEGASAELTVALASAPDAVASTSFEHDQVRRFVPDFAEGARVVEAQGPFNAPWIPYAGAAGLSVGVLLLVVLLRSSEGATERREERRAERDAVVRARRKRRIGGGVQDKLNDLSAHVLEAKGRGRSLDDTLDRAGLAMRSNEFVVLGVAITLASFLVGVALFGVPWFLLAALVPVAGIPGFLTFKIGRRRKKFVAQLGDTLQLMAGSLTAGYGLGQTLDSVARETDAPTSEEFQRVVMETRLGRSLEDALDAMSYRIGAQDFDWVVDAIKIQASVGGNLSEIIAQVGETIRARTRIRRQVDALTAEGKISALVLFCLPLGLFGFIYTSNPTYINPMFHSGIGQAMLGAAVFMLTCGGLWLKKLVNPEF